MPTSAARKRTGPGASRTSATGVRRGLGDTIPADALAELFWYGSPSFVSVRSLSDSSAILTLTFGADMRMADGSPYYRVRYDITDSPLPEESEDDAKNGD